MCFFPSSLGYVALWNSQIMFFPYLCKQVLVLYSKRKHKYGWPGQSNSYFSKRSLNSVDLPQSWYSPCSSSGKRQLQASSWTDCSGVVCIFLKTACSFFFCQMLKNIHEGSRNTMHNSPATASEILIMSIWIFFPGTVTKSGIPGEVVGRIVAKVGLSEVWLQTTSFFAVPGFTTWFAEHFVQFLQEPFGWSLKVP